MKSFTLVLSASLLALGCASKAYVYEPVTTHSAEVAGRPAADYRIPRDSPRGAVRLASFGYVDIRPEDAEGKIRALHLRMVVANDSDQPWRVDTRAQGLVLAHDGESRAAFATADAGGTPPPVVQVAPHARRTVDLFFPLPPSAQETDELPAFDAIWTVQTDASRVTVRTPFERLPIEPHAYGTSSDFGPPYWYDPLYPTAAFYGMVELPPPYLHRPVLVQPPKERAQP
jgi:hypothetical protein